MVNVTLIDSSFSHAFSRGNGNLKIYPKYVNFDRKNIHKTIFYTDDHIMLNFVDKFSNHKNIAWIIESKFIKNSPYNHILNNYQKYDYILTHDIELINTLNQKNYTNALWCPAGGCWIEESNRQIFKKTKNLSIIASDKRITYGHNLRHEIYNKYNNIFDGVFGRGYTPIENKIEGLKDYRFSLTIENENSKEGFTEKLIDCFVTGTVPIYYGSSNINKFFDPEGMLILNCLEDFEKIKRFITKDFYNSRLSSIKSNFENAKKYTNTEDWIFANYPHLFL
jgi:hypothetical protein